VKNDIVHKVLIQMVHAAWDRTSSLLLVLLKVESWKTETQHITLDREHGEAYRISDLHVSPSHLFRVCAELEIPVPLGIIHEISKYRISTIKHSHA
jgi:hypothetical protein